MMGWCSAEMLRSKSLNKKKHHLNLLFVVLAKLPMGGFVPDVRPRSNLLLNEFGVGILLSKLDIQWFDCHRSARGLHKRNSFGFRELAKAIFKHTANDYSGSVFVALLKKILTHFEKISKDIGLHKCLEMHEKTIVEIMLDGPCNPNHL